MKFKALSQSTLLILKLAALLVAVSFTTQVATAQSKPTVTSVTPINSSGSPQTFTAVYTDPAGNADLSNAYLSFNSTLSDSGGCWIIYVRGINTMYLMNDSGSGVAGAVTPGATGMGGSASNSQCTISNAGAVKAAGNNLTLPVNVAFNSSFTGKKNVYGFAAGFKGLNSGYQLMGTWTPRNPDCTLIVPSSPLSAAGLGTPYQLVATNPANGPCHEANDDQAAFVEAAILDLTTGQISIYHPLVVDSGASPVAEPIVPKVPSSSVVALWFGSNADGSLTLMGAPSQADCHQGMGQFAYCNAPEFFAKAKQKISQGMLSVPALGLGLDGMACPTVRDFAVVDQDQSDNLPMSYLVTKDGRVAQNNAANRMMLTNFTELKNGSDNRLLDVNIDPALKCSPWTAPDLSDPGQNSPGLALNEIQADLYQASPAALIPLGDPFVQNDLAKLNEYRAGVGQSSAASAKDAGTATYCTNMRAVAIQRLKAANALLTAAASPKPLIANNLLTFVAQRLDASYTNLDCKVQIGLDSPVHLTVVGGIVTAATISSK
jgi:hypothetical protein